MDSFQTASVCVVGVPTHDRTPAGSGGIPHPRGKAGYYNHMTFDLPSSGLSNLTFVHFFEGLSVDFVYIF